MFAQGYAILMLGLLFALPCLISAMLAHTDPSSSIQAALTIDSLKHILLQLGFADVCRCFYVSKGFSNLAKPIFEEHLCFITHKGRAYLNYTEMLHEMNVIMVDAAKDRDSAEAYAVLAASPKFVFLQSVLEMKFGYCIGHEKEGLPQFYLEGGSLGILHDERKLSILPYVIDRHVYPDMMIPVIRELAMLERFDLLEQIKLKWMNTRYFKQLMGVFLPRAVIINAVKALKENFPSSGLLKWLHYTGFDREAVLLEDFEPPLFILRHLHENDIPIPRYWSFVDGLEESSISFWMYLINSEPNKAAELANIVMKQGDAGSRHLLRSFYEPVPATDLLPGRKDVYQAMLLRFRSKHIPTMAGTLVYDTVLESSTAPGIHFAEAMVDCRQFHLIDRCAVKGHETAFASRLIERICRFTDGKHDSLVAKYVKLMGPNHKFFRRLIHQKVNDSYLEIIWDPICMAMHPGSSGDRSCVVQFSTVKSLTLGLDLCFDDARRVLGMLAALDSFTDAVSNEERIFRTAICWMASEEIITRLLDQLPTSCVLNQKEITPLVLLNRYSNEFWKKVMGRCGHLEPCLSAVLERFRHDLTMELGLLKEKGPCNTE